MINVYPLDDSAEHTLDTTCDCCPRVDFDLPQILVVHNAFDGRVDGDGGPPWHLLAELPYAEDRV